MQCLNVPQLFKEAELQFIKKYYVVFEHIAQALDRLQGDKHCFYGELLPTILSSHRKLSQLEDDTTGIMRYCLPLVNRFSDFTNLSPGTCHTEN